MWVIGFWVIGFREWKLLEWRIKFSRSENEMDALAYIGSMKDFPLIQYHTDPDSGIPV